METCGAVTDVVAMVDLDFGSVPDYKEAGLGTTPGGFLCVNDDDDDHNGTPDKDDVGPTLGEDDLMPLTITADGAQQGILTLSALSGGQRIKLYENPDRSNPVTLPTSWNLFALGRKPESQDMRGRRIRHAPDACGPTGHFRGHQEEGVFGHYKNRGCQWHRKGEAPKVNGHDRPSSDVPRAHPYGVYDLARSRGFVNVGTDHDTGTFAVASVRKWWRAQGNRAYPKSKTTADDGRRGSQQRGPVASMEVGTSTFG